MKASERRRRMRMQLRRANFETRYKFVEECGCGWNVEANSIEGAMEAFIQDYIGHEHNRGRSDFTLAVQERPGIQVGRVYMNHTENTATFRPGGPPFPCGSGYDQVCYSCGNRYHYESPPIEHPELREEGGGDDVQVCDDCFQRLQRKLAE